MVSVMNPQRLSVKYFSMAPVSGAVFLDVNLMKVVIAAVTGDDKRRRAVLGDGLFDALIIVDVARQNEIGHAAGVADRVFQRIRHLGAAAMIDIKGIDRVMQGQNECPIGRGDNLFSTHPSTENRVAALERLAREMDVGGFGAARPRASSAASGPWGIGGIGE